MIRHWPLLFIMVSEWLNMILQLDKLFSVLGGGAKNKQWDWAIPWQRTEEAENN